MNKMVNLVNHHNHKNSHNPNLVICKWFLIGTFQLGHIFLFGKPSTDQNDEVF